MESVSVGIIGLGAIGMKYDLAAPEQVFTHVRAALSHPQADLLWGVDPDEASRAEFANVTGCTAYSSVADVPAGERPDLVIVATPTSTHRAVASDAIGMRPRLLLMEKPLAMTFEEGEEMLSEAKDAGVGIAVNYFRRFDPGVRWLLDWLEEGRLGSLQAGHGYYSRGLLNNGSHFINLTQYWLGDPEWMRGIRVSRKWSDGDADAAFELGFANDVSIRFDPVDHDHFSFYELDLLFTEARVVLDDRFGLNVFDVSEDPNFPGYRTLRGTPQLAITDFSRYQYHVLDALIAGQGIDWSANAQAALETLRICERVRADLVGV